MLEIFRKPNETLILFTSDGMLKINIHSIKNQQVRIDLDIPRSVTLLRDEVIDKQIRASYRKSQFSI